MTGIADSLRAAADTFKSKLDEAQQGDNRHLLEPGKMAVLLVVTILLAVSLVIALACSNEADAEGGATEAE